MLTDTNRIKQTLPEQCQDGEYTILAHPERREFFHLALLGHQKPSQKCLGFSNLFVYARQAETIKYMITLYQQTDIGLSVFLYHQPALIWL